MTGHGQASLRQDGVAVAVEVRTINSRYFKLTVRAGEGNVSLESQIESLVRAQIRRGTVQIHVKIDCETQADDFQLNQQVLANYRRQLESLCDQQHVAESIRFEALLGLPGVVDEQVSANGAPKDTWRLVQQAVTEALVGLRRMRAEEGRAMAADLKSNCDAIITQLDAIQDRAPAVVEAYRGRLADRLNHLLAEFDVSVESSDIIREVGMFAERCDISEEIVRLRSHLEQFDTIMQADDSNGRKLEFLIQEMFRETNTIGSKANDAEIARYVVEVKTMIERMREMIQNVE